MNRALAAWLGRALMPAEEKRALIVRLLRTHGELYPVELVKLSGERLTLGSVFRYLHALEQAERIERREVPLADQSGRVKPGVPVERRSLYRPAGWPTGWTRRRALGLDEHEVHA